MVADVAFDAPIAHPFSYRVPEGLTVTRGQRVLAPLRGASRVGVVVDVRADDGEKLKPILRAVEPAPVLDDATLDLVGWIAADSATSLGSTCLTLMPPPTSTPMPRARAEAKRCDPATPELLIGAGREARLIERIAGAGTTTLVLAADIEGAARWAQRLGKLGHVVRLDSGVADAERSQAWHALAGGQATLAVGTRSALLAPLPAGATVALIDEHEAAHKPPGAPRMHTRDIALERARRDGLRALLTSATPSVELWWQCDSGRMRLDGPPPAPWPVVSVADTRGIAKREALTPALARAIRETLAAGRRVFLGVSRLASILGCDECGAILKCEACAIALAYSPAGRTLTCRLCGTARPLIDVCPACRGRRLAPFGWGAERVEHAVRRRFVSARIARFDPEATRGARAEAQRKAALSADVVIGTRGALRLFGPASLGLAGFVSPDQLLGLPDFRATERAFGVLWAAAERVGPDGQLIVQSQNPGHYALDAVSRQDLTAFYKPELKFRAELGYPPFRRLAIVTVAAPSGSESAKLADVVTAALAGAPRLTVYPATPDRRNRARRIVVKGHADLPRVLAAALDGAEAIGAARSRGIMDVEVDPVEWPS